MTNLNKPLGYDPIAETAFGSTSTYHPVYQTLTDIISPNSVADLGCRVGYLISIFKENGASVIGFDVFEYNKNSCQPNIKDNFVVCDLRKPFPKEYTTTKYDLIVSTEVGEHIDPEHSITYLQNIKSLMHKESKLLISWSPDGNDIQHVNALSKEDFHFHMNNNGFKHCNELTEKFWSLGISYGIGNELPWYFTGNISVWEI